MTCKGICVRYKAQKPVGTGRYASGQRRCQICEIFIKWEGLWCPCCGYRLRTKPRNLKYKAKLRARVEADAIEADTKSIESMEREIQAEAAAAAKPKTKAKTTKAKTTKAKTTKAKTTKAKTTKAKTTKSKDKTSCQYCEKPYVFIDKHEKKCKKNPILLNQ
jgi:spore germination protein YaaH